jgi:hypothetical protein
MRPVSPAFLAAVTGSHTMAVRAVLVDAAPQFTTRPTGEVLPILAGDVSLSARTDVKSTLSLTVPGAYWSDVQPYGNEVYVQRGVRLGSGEVEYADLGYHRIEQADQEDAPYGPIVLTCLDRVAQLQQNKLPYPIPVDEGATHRAVFERLINGGTGLAPIEGTAYAAYPAAPVPIIWNAYDPDAATIFSDQVVADDSYKFLAALAAERNATLRFDGSGRLVIASITVNAAVAVASIHGGSGGTRTKISRTSSRKGVYNIVTAYGSDPANATGFVVTFNSDSSSPLAWNRTAHPAFGPAPRYFASPLLQDDAAVESASARLLDRYTGLPEPLTISCVPNPAIEPDDVIDVPMAGRQPYRVVVDTHVIPLVADQLAKITTRTLNDSEGSDRGLIVENF